jgi:S1-C subfamily serine protease
MLDNNNYFERQNAANQAQNQFPRDPENIFSEPIQQRPRPPYKPKKRNNFLSLSIWFLSFLLVFIVLFGGYLIYKSPDNLGLKKYLNFDRINGSEMNTQSSVAAKKDSIKFAPQADAKSTVEVVSKNLPSVVSIDINNKNGVAVAGTGFIVSPEGLLITNKHVVSLGCRFGVGGIQITALGSDQKAYSAELLSVDPIDDIAILQLKEDGKKPSNLPTIEFGDSSQLQLGEEVVAIGNALGTFQNSVTKGVVSGLNRSFDTSGLKDECTGTDVRTDGLIQTDAAINQGNSGGPLFNAAGQIIGMNTLGSPDAQNVGLAIPSETILTVLNSYKSNQTIIRPRLGVISQEINAARKLVNPWLPVGYGEFVGSFDIAVPENKVISSGSAAEEANISFGDIILELDGQKLESTPSNPTPLRRLILNQQSGQVINLKILKAIKTSNATQINYNSEPVNITIKLKGLNYDIKTSTLVNSEG